MSRRWHDPDAAECLCRECSERRWHAAFRAAELAEEAELAEAANRRATAELQLRLPMHPLPNVAHNPLRLQRAAALPCQPELI